MVKSVRLMITTSIEDSVFKLAILKPMKAGIGWQ